MNLIARVSKSSIHAITELNQPTPNSDPDCQGHSKPAHARASVGPSRIGAGVSFVGRLESNGEVQVDGSVEGEIRGYAVRLGGEARVKGNIAGEIAQLSGLVEGNIEAQTVILTKSSRISGEIRYRSLQIEEGAFIDGNCRPLKQSPLA